MNWRLTIEDCVRDACLIEVHAEKPGNVSPTRQFDDIDIQSFVLSADAVAPILARSDELSVGEAILKSVQATQHAVGSNTNLGIVLLIAPLAAVPQETGLRSGIQPVLQNLTVNDAANTFEAIRLAAPGGLGDADTEDVSSAPTLCLRECMSLAVDRDLIAAQYDNGFHHVLTEGVALLRQTADWPEQRQSDRLAWLALRLMAAYGDSLVLRKCGRADSREVSERAAAVLSGGWPLQTVTDEAYDDFDKFLRADGHRRNPGTTADMIAAIVFACLRDRIIVAVDEGRQFRFVD